MLQYLPRRMGAFVGIAKRRLKWYWKHRGVPKSDMLSFRCNICGYENLLLESEMGREAGGCLYCGSTVRWRSIIYALSMELFGKNLVLEDFPVRKDIQGVGLSDWPGYGEKLAEKFTYKNTFYHCDPRLDISNPDPSEFGKYDFLISSDVFEHVPPPIAAAFVGVRKLLKPAGIVIFSVPYVEGSTKEHFPELYRFSFQKKNSSHILLNETADGRKQEFTEVTFHGGPGSTLEMRLFGRDSLMAEFRNAGFAEPHEYRDEVPEFGIFWVKYNPEKAPYRPFILGLDTPPWAVRCA
jgi:SAM-dependent methyltransferase